MRFLAVVFILFLFNSAYPQKEVLRKAEKINWYGLDFSEARFIGTRGFENPDEVCRDMINMNWNNLAFKYSIGYSFPGKPIELYPEVMREANSKVNPSAFIASGEYSFDRSICQKVINGYKSINTSGLSCVFIVETFNKNKTQATIWVVVFEPFTKQIFYAERFIGSPKGAGVTNYWFGAVRAVMKKMRRKIYGR